MKVVKSFRGREFEIKDGFKLNYPKKTLMDQDQMIQKYLRSEKFGTESETANYLEGIKSFSKRNFVAKIYYVEADRIGRIDFVDFEVIVQYYAFKNRKGEWLPFAQNMKLKKYGELAYEFKYTPENIQILQMEMLKNGFDVVVFEKEIEQPSIADAQAQRIRILAMRYKYPEKPKLSGFEKLNDDDVFFVDNEGDFSISESGLYLFMKMNFGVNTEIQIMSLRLAHISFNMPNGKVSDDTYNEIVKYLKSLEKRFEISTFVFKEINKIGIDSVLDIALYH